MLLILRLKSVSTIATLGLRLLPLWLSRRCARHLEEGTRVHGHLRLCAFIYLLFTYLLRKLHKVATRVDELRKRGCITELRGKEYQRRYLRQQLNRKQVSAVAMTDVTVLSLAMSRSDFECSECSGS